jgi:microcin C transport system ATP-binding protein
MIFQEPMTALNPLFSVGEQIAEVLQLKQGLSPAQAQDAAVGLLADTGIPEPERRARAYPHQLSGGQRQRAMIAMALACQPRLLLADEPTGNLDPRTADMVFNVFVEMCRARGVSALIATHNLQMAVKMDRTWLLHDGKLIDAGKLKA